MPTQQPKHILIAPLDWGLGHTTRCIPLIRHIQSLGHNPIVACDVSQRSFIEETFGGIEIIHLEGYNIRYSKWNRFAQAGLLSQLPHLTRTIGMEHKWLGETVGRRQIDGIVSDNRYGLYHRSVPSVILTHQLQVLSGLGSGLDQIIRKVHYKYLGRFGTRWVADLPGTINLAGKLSHPAAIPPGTTYIGLLSRFENVATEPPDREQLLILLSGPEPQRSRLSNLLWKQVLAYCGKVTFVEGSEHVKTPADIPNHITYYKRLTEKSLEPIIANAGMIICRSGYSTLMDLVCLGKKAIVIPTPGQTEQEYLGRHLHEQGIFYCTKQKGFDLATAISKAQQFPFNSAGLTGAYTIHKRAVADWISSL